MAHVGDVQISYRFVRNILAGCCGGSGFLLLKIQGSGTVFLTASGTIMEKILARMVYERIELFFVLKRTCVLR